MSIEVARALEQRLSIQQEAVKDRKLTRRAVWAAIAVAIITAIGLIVDVISRWFSKN